LDSIEESLCLNVSIAIWEQTKNVSLKLYVDEELYRKNLDMNLFLSKKEVLMGDDINFKCESMLDYVEICQNHSKKYLNEEVFIQ